MGGDGRSFRATGHYTHPGWNPIERRNVNEWRVYGIWHFAGRPLSMFVF